MFSFPWNDATQATPTTTTTTTTSSGSSGSRVSLETGGQPEMELQIQMEPGPNDPNKNIPNVFIPTTITNVQPQSATMSPPVHTETNLQMTTTPPFTHTMDPNANMTMPGTRPKVPISEQPTGYLEPRQETDQGLDREKFVYHGGHVYQKPQRSISNPICIFNQTEHIRCSAGLKLVEGKWTKSKRGHSCINYQIREKPRIGIEDLEGYLSYIEEGIAKGHRWLDYFKKEIDEIFRKIERGLLLTQSIRELTEELLEELPYMLTVAVQIFQLPNSLDEKISLLKAKALKLAGRKYTTQVHLRCLHIRNIREDEGILKNHYDWIGQITELSETVPEIRMKLKAKATPLTVALFTYVNGSINTEFKVDAIFRKQMELYVRSRRSPSLRQKPTKKRGETSSDSDTNCMGTTENKRKIKTSTPKVDSTASFRLNLNQNASIPNQAGQDEKLDNTDTWMEYVKAMTQSNQDFLKHLCDSLARQMQPTSQDARNVTTRSELPHFDPPADWYAELPHPWDKVPKQEVVKMSEVKKMLSILPKFKGTPESYIPFRDAFIASVHELNITIKQKSEILYFLLEEKDSQVKAIKHLIYIRKDGYKTAIERLEKSYGGPNRTLKSNEDTLDNLRNVPNYNLKALREFIASCSAFEMDKNFNHYIVHKRMKQCFSNIYLAEYNQYLYDNNTSVGTVKTLLEWARRKEEILALDEDINRPGPQKVAQVGRSATYVDKFSNSPEEDACCSSTNTHSVPEIDKVETTHYQDNESEDIFEARIHYAMLRGDKKQEPESFLCDMIECVERHLLTKCPVFQEMDTPTRFQHIRESKRCINCFHKGHIARDCPKRFTCRTCKRKHNTLLHGFNEKRTNVVVEGDSRRSLSLGGSVFLTKDNREIRDIITLKTVTVKAESPITGEGVIVNVMLDSGSNLSMISSKLSRALNLTEEPGLLTLHGINGQKEIPSSRTQVIIKSLESDYQTRLDVRVKDNLMEGWKAADWQKLKRNWSHLKNLPLVSAPNRDVDMIIGNDYAHTMRSASDIYEGNQVPIARLTPLGWALSGNLSHPDEGPKKEVSEYISGAYYVGYSYQDLSLEAQHQELNEQFRKWIQADKLSAEEGEDKAMSNEEKYAMAKLKKSIKFENQRYEVSCLWRKGEPQLICNYPQAVVRLNKLESMPIFKDPEVRAKYYDKIEEYEAKGYIEKVPQSELENKKSFYLAHFPVLKANVNKTKIRPVFDGKSRYYNKGLNDSVLAGPKLINDLRQVLIKFCRYDYAGVGDLSEMFLQLKMTRADKDYHRFLARSKPNDPIVQYRWLRHAFGNSGSPCVAIFTFREHAKKYLKRYPEAANMIIENTIVDDTLFSCKSRDELALRLREMREIYADASSQFGKICSNDIEILKDLPKGSLAGETEIRTENKLTPLTTLGLMWDPASDNFSFPKLSRSKPDEQPWTRHWMLKVLCAIFDPMGILSPFIVLGRHWIQQSWSEGLEWDEPIKNGILTGWTEWTEQLGHLSAIRYERVLQPASAEVKEQELHAFADASGLAYGAVMYLRTIYLDGTSVVRNVMALGRVVPLKRETIPRLELRAACLNVELSRLVADALKIKTCTYWTDSGCVLAWLKSPDKMLKPFVGNRTSFIQDKSLGPWKWVDSENNPADVVSRGSKLECIQSNDLWKYGPPFLTDSSLEPDQSRVDLGNGKDELKKEFQEQSESDTLVMATDVSSSGLAGIPFESFKDWPTMIRFVKIFLAKIHQKRGRQVSHAQLWQKARHVILREVQAEAFSEELQWVKSNQLPKDNYLAKLCPVLGDDGLLRTAGRLTTVKGLTQVERFKIILPTQSLAIEKFIRHMHCASGHMVGPNQLWAEITKKFWIVRGRNLIKRIVRDCQMCKYKKPSFLKVPESKIPDFRVTGGSDDTPTVFAVTAMDCAGPFYAKRSRGQKTINKRYLLLLNCSLYRAAHLEMVNDLGTSEFMLAFSRFLATKPRPKVVYSDSFRTFSGADHTLTGYFQTLDNTVLQMKYPDIEWKFSIPYSPSTNGITERLIGITKKCLKTVLSKEYTDVELGTAFKQVEGILNNRPLGIAPSDLDLPVLTPNHFLLGQVTTSLEVKDRTLGQRWNELQDLMDFFWKRFRKEIIPMYNQYHKIGPKNHRNFKVGDIVMYLDPLLKGVYHRGIVVEAIPGSDGIVRRLKLKFAKSDKEFIRHANQVALLCPENENEQKQQ